MTADNYQFPAAIAAACRGFLRPAPDETVEQWLGRCIQLNRGTDSPGFVSLQNFPFARKIVELAKSRRPTQVVACLASQSSKTSQMLFAAAYRARNLPADTLFATANQTMSTGYSTRRWLPMLNDSAVMREIFPLDKRKIAGPSQRFLTHNMIWTGSHSEANLKGNPCRDLFGDEIDIWGDATADHDSALEGFLQRNKAFAGSFTMLSSTPTTRDGAIWRLLLAGSNERFFVPCQDCGHMQFLKWEQVVWPQECRQDDGSWNLRAVEEGARLLCERCQSPHTNGQRLAIVQRGEWQALNPGAMPDEYSFQLNGLYVHHPKSSMGKLAAKFCRAKNTRNLDLLQAFITGDLAEPWEPKLHADGTAIDVVAGDYGPGETWDQGRWLTSTWDVHPDRMEGEVRLWAENADSRLIWEGVVSTWGELDKVVKSYNVPAEHVGVDSGYLTPEVYKQCRDYGWTPMKGEQRGFYIAEERTSDGQPLRTRWRESWGHMSDGRVIPLLLFASYAAQDELAFLLSGNGPSYTSHRSTSERYRVQMKSHAKVERGGKTVWDKVMKRDEAWDVATMGVVMADRLGILHVK